MTGATVAFVASTTEILRTFGDPLAEALARHLPGTLIVPHAAPAAAAARYVVLADFPDSFDIAAHPLARAVLALWAGVDALIPRLPAGLPLARLIDPDGLTAGMTDWVVAHVTRHHVGLDRFVLGTDRAWMRHAPPLARDRKVGILGLGELGAAAARALASLGFDLAGWSRTPKDIPGLVSHTGADGLRAVIERSEILVLLVPHTPETEDLMNAERLSWMPEGSVLLNPGRGALVDEDALTGALARGRPAHATLDTFRVEPLPDDHPFWTHPQVTVTPHIASATRPASAAEVTARNIARAERGEPLENLVDRGRGY